MMIIKFIPGVITASIIALASVTATAQVAAVSSDTVERVVHICNVCHGLGGKEGVEGSPNLAGQPAAYFAQQLRYFRTQKRADANATGDMWSISVLLDEPMVEGLADYYEAQTPVPGKTGNAALMEQGKRIYQQGVPASNVMACAACHGENGEGGTVFPRLASQQAEYTVSQLKGFLTKLRPHGSVMSEREAKHLTKDEMRAVAAYLQAK
jgi:cytochrome c553